MDPLSYEIRTRGKAKVVVCRGGVVFGSALSELSAQARALLQESPLLVFNLAEVAMLDSAGIGALFGIHTSAQNAGATMAIAAPSPAVRKVLALTRMNTIFPVYESEDEALAAQGC